MVLACPTLPSEVDDKRVFLSCVALGSMHDKKRTRVIAQCRKPKTESTLLSMGVDAVIYVEDLKMAMVSSGRN